MPVRRRRAKGGCMGRGGGGHASSGLQSTAQEETRQHAG